MGKALASTLEPHFLRQQHVVFPQNLPRAGIRCTAKKTPHGLVPTFAAFSTIDRF